MTRLGQFVKASGAMSTTLSLISSFSRLIQPRKAHLSMDFRFVGMLIFDNEMQSRKVSFSIRYNRLLSLTSDNLSQEINAAIPTTWTLSVIVTFLISQLHENARNSIVLYPSGIMISSAEILHLLAILVMGLFPAKGGSVRVVWIAPL